MPNQTPVETAVARVECPHCAVTYDDPPVLELEVKEAFAVDYCPDCEKPVVAEASDVDD
jgi:endogenous inhibitor of DNA gyrase (YacG/DUF329 family)